MILLITPSNRGEECATAIEVATGRTVRATTSFQQAIECLRSEEYSVVIIDECLLDADPEGGEVLVQRIETAMPVYANCAVNGIPRIVRLVKAALRRRQGEEASAQKAARLALQSQIREPLTAIILNCELALKGDRLPASAEERIRTVDGLARELGSRLDLEQSAAGKSDYPVLRH
ncbi:MAG TPA: hypothetical protein VFI95_19235 [Terriglobales bacterium]|nr:hypothetical protein [Terriglobales bacterium]